MTARPQLLITGANGFTGQHACAYFLTLNYDVTAVVRNDQAILPAGIVPVSCDLTDKYHVKQLVQNVKPDFVLHLAGQNSAPYSWKDPVATIEKNSLSTLYLIDAIRSENLQCKIVVIGSALQYDPQQISTLHHPYSLSKTMQILIAEAYVALYSMNIAIAVPTNLIGPGSSNGVCSIFARKIVQMEKEGHAKVLEVNNLSARRDFIDVRDAVRAYELILTKGKSGEVYQIESGKHCSLGEIINSFKKMVDFDFTVSTAQSHDEYTKQEGRIHMNAQDLGWKQTFELNSSLLDTLNYFRNLSDL